MDPREKRVERKSLGADLGTGKTPRAPGFTDLTMVAALGHGGGEIGLGRGRRSGERREKPTA